jgi:hypothetical protein
MIYTRILLRVALVIAFIIVMNTVSGLSQTSSEGVKMTANVIHQLRIYKIFDSNKTAFHKRFPSVNFPLIRSPGRGTRVAATAR